MFQKALETEPEGTPRQVEVAPFNNLNVIYSLAGEQMRLVIRGNFCL